ncbi:MAG: hypothetical protein H7067_13475, partial [Burkholderiales bacterium]|nr:hypothetical protein [Opitutaceae bacterium]
AEARSVVVSSTSKSPGTQSLVPSPDTATLTWTRPATADLPALHLTVTVRRDASNAPFEVVSGVLSRGGQTFAHLYLGGLIYLPPSKTTLAWGGAHTFLVHPPASPHASIPHGFGHATASIAPATGVLKLTGQLADGAPLTASLRPSTLRGYVLWATPYGSRLDSFLGGYLATQPHPDLSGRLQVPDNVSPPTWKKAALPPSTKASSQDKSYRAGFGPLTVPVSLEPWLPPVAAKPAKGSTPAIPAITLADRLGLATASLGLDYLPPPDAAFTEAQIDGLPASLGLTVAGKPILPLVNPAKFALTLNPTTGAFSGSFFLTDTVPAPTQKDLAATKSFPRKVSFSGVLRHRQPIDLTDITSEVVAPTVPVGQGFFLLSALPDPASTEQLSGEIRFTAP